MGEEMTSMGSTYLHTKKINSMIIDIIMDGSDDIDGRYWKILYLLILK